MIVIKRFSHNFCPMVRVTFFATAANRTKPMRMASVDIVAVRDGYVDYAVSGLVNITVPNDSSNSGWVE